MCQTTVHLENTLNDITRLLSGRAENSLTKTERQIATILVDNGYLVSDRWGECKVFVIPS